mmetsp:Transcript_53106/g.113403  ORF Transcript_53106/g.113403 Transcript_53106/m.113403 type:complete len:277 (-) Transcript_53106:44-874(-)
MHAISTETSVVERWGECQMLRIAVHGCQQLCLGVGTMAPANCSFGLQRPANRLQYSFFIHTEDVLFLRAQGQHADAPAEDDETILFVGFVEAAPLRLDAHRKVSAGGADVDQKSLSGDCRGWELGEGDGVHGISGDGNEEGSVVLVDVVVAACLQKCSCFLALLSVVSDPQMHPGGGLNEFLQGATSDRGISLGLLDGGDLRLLEEQGLRSNEGFVLDSLACSILFDVLAGEGRHLFVSRHHSGGFCLLLGGGGGALEVLALDALAGGHVAEKAGG